MQDVLKETALAVCTSSSREDRMCAKGDATCATEDARWAKENAVCGRGAIACSKGGPTHVKVVAPADTE
jgi:hypothetical protein